jgi:predicted nucleotidyltransferase
VGLVETSKQQKLFWQMSCNISSERLNNPLLKDILERLTEYFQSIHSEFYIIGATARDIILTAIHGQETKRSTMDLDITIAISDWSQFEIISNGLCQLPDFEKSKGQKQRFTYRNIYSLDIVPFGKIATDDATIYWSPEEDVAMSVSGFAEAAKDVLEVSIDDEFSIKVIQLPGIFILKMGAYKDRHLANNKDADDLAFILSNYLDINEERAIEEYFDEIYNVEKFNILVAGATLLGKDIKRLLESNKRALDYFVEILQNEITMEDESPLINQMLETHSSLKYEEVFEALQKLLNEFSHHLSRTSST